MKRVFSIIIILGLIVTLHNIAMAKGKGWRTDESEKYLKWWDRTYQGADSAIIGGINYQKGDYQTAITELEKSIQSGSTDGRIYYQLAYCYQQIGNTDKAIELYKQSIELLDQQDPQHRYDYYAKYNLALLYKDKNDIANAVKVMQDVLKKDKEPSGYNLLGWLLWKQGRSEEAINEYKTSIQIDSNQEDAQYNMGVLYYNKGEFEHARKAFDRVIKINPQNQKALTFIENLGDPEMLKSSGYTELSLPDPALRHCYKGKQLLDEGNIAAAREEYETAYEVNPDSFIVNQGLAVVYEYNKKGIRYGRGSNIDKAVFHYEKAVMVEPHKEEIVFNLAVAYNLADKVNESIRMYERLIRENPDYAQVHYNLAVLYDNNTDNSSKARYHYIRYLALEPNTPKKSQINQRLSKLEK